LIIANQGSISGAITSGLSLDGHSVVINAAGGSIGGAVYGIFGAEEETIINAGSIAATFQAIRIGGGASIFNAGTISGG
ncbi:hypothetical protein, partial [Bacillus pumilus]